MRNIDLEIVIVDDSSPDGTAEVVRQLQKAYKDLKIVGLVHRKVLYERPGKLGIGTAYVEGIQKCSGEFIILMDADLSHHVSQAVHLSPDIFQIM